MIRFGDCNKKGNFRYQDKNSNIDVKKGRLLFFNGKLLFFLLSVYCDERRDIR